MIILFLTNTCVFVCPDVGKYSRDSCGLYSAARGFGEGRAAVLSGERGRQGEGELRQAGVDPIPCTV